MMYLPLRAGAKTIVFAVFVILIISNIIINDKIIGLIITPIIKGINIIMGLMIKARRAIHNIR